MKNKSIYLLSLVLLVALIFNPYGTDMWDLPKVQYLAIFLSGFGISLAFYLLIKGKIEIRYNKIIYIFVGVWFLSLLISTIFSIAPQLSFWGSYERMQGLYTHIIYLLFFIIFLNFLKNEKIVKIFLKILIAIASVTVIHAIFQQFGIGIFKDYAMEEFLNRSFAAFGHPNFLGQFLVFPIWATIYFSIKTEGKQKIFPVLLTILLIIGLLLTKNRASILGIVVGGIFFILFWVDIKKIYKYILSVGALTAFALFVIFFASNLTTLTTRFLLWKNALKIFPNHPFLGSGLETFKLVFQKVATPNFFNSEKLYEIADRSHNAYLDILITQGTIGLLIFTGIITGIFYLFFKKYKKVKNPMLLLISVSALISVLVANFFGFPATSDYLLLVALMAIILNFTMNFKSLKIKKNLILIFITGIITAFSIFTGFNAVKTIYADNILEKGMKNIYQGNIESGLIQMGQAAELNKHQEHSFYTLAELLSSIGKELNDKEIIKKADSILEYGGNFTNQDFVYYLLKAKINTQLENYTDAEEYFQKGAELAPFNPLIMKEWGTMYYLKGDYEKTIEKLEELLSTLPEYWQWKPELPKLSFEEQEKYRLFVKHIPNFDEIFVYLAESYKKIGNQEKTNYYEKFNE